MGYVLATSPCIGCGHVFSLVRGGHVAAGPDEIRGPDPNQANALAAPRSALGVSFPPVDRCVIISSAPMHIVEACRE